MTNLQKVHYFLKDLESPDHFILWNYLYSVSSCLGRKVWLQGEEFSIYPNEYMIFVGPPACGKSLPANRMTKTLKSLVEAVPGKPMPIPLVNITPDCITLESLYEFIEGSSRAFKTPSGSPEFYYHASVSFALGDEMGILFKNKEATQDLIMFLIKGYECGQFEYRTKTKGRNEIKNMCINFLGCCTPEWVTSNFTKGIIDLGFSSRVIFIYGDAPRHRRTFITTSPEQLAAMEEVKKHFRFLAKIYGEVTLSDKAYKILDNWVQTQQDDESLRINKDKKLLHYYGRKKIHWLKVAMMVHFSEKTNMVVDEEDIIIAGGYLAHVEVNMHKALAIQAVNPLATLASKILRIIKEKGGVVSSNYVLAHAFEGGNEQEIEAAKKFLIDTQQIRTQGLGLTISEAPEGSAETSGG